MHTEEMLNVYLNWGDLALETLQTDVLNKRLCEGCSYVVISGMGGSGIAGDYIRVVADEYSRLPVYVVKDFALPHWVRGGNAMVLSVSYSGNTLETIAAFESALKRGVCVGVVTSGGELEVLARRYSVPLALVRGGLVPRIAFPALLIASLRILWESGVDIVPQQVVTDSLSALRDDRARREAEELAEFLKDSRLPVIVAPSRMAPLAIRAKNEFNENSKLPVKVEVAPELFHNDIVGWELRSFTDKAVLFLTGNRVEDELTRFYGDILKDLGHDVYEVPLRGGSVLYKLLYGTLLVGLASVYLARDRGVDPLETKTIARYKEFLKRLGDIRRWH